MGRQQASKLYKTKRKNRDLDQILHDDLKSQASIHSLEHQKFDEYLPGLGQHYCVPCAKYFETDIALKSHVKQKVHKRQLRALKFGPYTAEEANAGAGRDVQKFLKKQQEQEQIQKQAPHLNAETKEEHKKPAKRTMTGSAEMEIEESVDEQQSMDAAGGPVEQEISV